MKVLLAVHHFPPRYSAGAELYTFRLARWLIEHGHEAEVVCIETLDEERPVAVEAIQDTYEGVSVWRLHLGLRNAPSNWSYANPMVAGWVADYMRAARPDLLHLQSGYLIGAGVLEVAHQLGVPSIVTLHDYWFLCPRITLLRSDGKVCTTPPTDPAECAWCLQQDQRRYRLTEQLSGGAAGRTWIALNGEAGRHEQAARRAYLHKALGLAALVIAPSQFLAGMFRDLVEPARLQVVRLGVKLEPLRQTPPPPQGNPLQLAYIGQIAQHKGVHLIIEALRLLPQGERTVQLQVYGDLDQHPTYTQRLRNLMGKDARITLAGRFANGRIAEILATVDALIVPSIWYENSPLTILEAQTAGRPVIASAFGGMAELVQDEVDGLHFRPGEAKDLARQIKRLRDEPGLLARLVAGVRTPTSIDEELDCLLATYTRIIAQHQPSLLPEAV